jgi:hypothetical protein
MPEAAATDLRPQSPIEFVDLQLQRPRIGDRIASRSRGCDARPDRRGARDGAARVIIE